MSLFAPPTKSKQNQPSWVSTLRVVMLCYWMNRSLNYSITHPQKYLQRLTFFSYTTIKRSLYVVVMDAFNTMLREASKPLNHLFWTCDCLSNCQSHVNQASLRHNVLDISNSSFYLTSNPLNIYLDILNDTIEWLKWRV